MADYAGGSSVKGVRPGGGRPGEVKSGAGSRGHRLSTRTGPASLQGAPHRPDRAGSPAPASPAGSGSMGTRAEAGNALGEESMSTTTLRLLTDRVTGASPARCLRTRRSRMPCTMRRVLRPREASTRSWPWLTELRLDQVFKQLKTEGLIEEQTLGHVVARWNSARSIPGGPRWRRSRTSPPKLPASTATARPGSTPPRGSAFPVELSPHEVLSLPRDPLS